MAEVPTTTTLMDEVPPPAPDFSKAVTRPVGVGNLQVVRQEIIGYRPGEISHIENVLEGEMLHRRTRRHEFVETFETSRRPAPSRGSGTTSPPTATSWSPRRSASPGTRRVAPARG